MEDEFNFGLLVVLITDFDLFLLLFVTCLLKLYSKVELEAFLFIDLLSYNE
jgi:hypothetical protein